MAADQSREVFFKAELSALVARGRYSAGHGVREDLFEALSALERKALIGGASDATLREIAEARFLTGILRESVQPARVGRLRDVLRVRDAVRPVPRCETRRRLEACRDQA